MTKSMRVLNRIVHWTQSGIEYEADQQHVEIIIRDLGLKPDSKSVNSPGTAAKWEDLEADKPLNSPERIGYRQIVARGNYISQDRCDIQYAVKELSRRMSSPRASDMRALKGLVGIWWEGPGVSYAMGASVESKASVRK